MRHQLRKSFLTASGCSRHSVLLSAPTHISPLLPSPASPGLNPPAQKERKAKGKKEKSKGSKIKKKQKKKEEERETGTGRELRETEVPPEIRIFAILLNLPNSPSPFPLAFRFLKLPCLIAHTHRNPWTVAGLFKYRCCDALTVKEPKTVGSDCCPDTKSAECARFSGLSCC